MTLNEFRAWFDGFSEAIGDAPTPEQWAKIKAKLAQARDPVHVPSVTLPAILPQYPPTAPSWPSTAPLLGEVTCGGGRITTALSNANARN